MKQDGCLTTLAVVGGMIGVLMTVLTLMLVWAIESSTSLGKLGTESIPLRVDDPNPAAVGALVSVTGPVTSHTQIDDAYLAPGPYVRLQRTVEMYAYVRSSDETTYHRYWTHAPSIADGNSPLPHKNAEFAAESADVAGVNFSPRAIDASFALKPLHLTPAHLRPDLEERIDGSYVFIGTGTVAHPEIGDVRVSYTALTSGTLTTAFGAWDGVRLVPFAYDGAGSMYRLCLGDRAAAVAELNRIEVTGRWFFRIAACIVVFFSLVIALFLSRPLINWTALPILGANPFVLAAVFTMLVVVPAIAALVFSGGHPLTLLTAPALISGAGVWLCRKLQRAR